MIAPEVSDRIATVIFAAARCRGFALVLFYDDDGASEITNRRDALVNGADPRSAAEMLTQIADDFYRQVSSNVLPSPR